MLTKNEIQRVKSLQKKEHRLFEKLFVVEGQKLCEEVIQSELKIHWLICTEDWAQQNYQLINHLSKEIIKIVPFSTIERLTSLQTPQPVVAVVDLSDSTFVLPENELLLALDGVQDPGNLGTIIRIADWFGINTILCSENCADVYNPKVLQSTMGAFLRVKVHYGDLIKMLNQLKSNGFTLSGTVLNGSQISDVKVNDAFVLVMGNESKGISFEIEKLLDQKITIPRYPLDSTRSESLNVANACAIACYELRKNK